METHELAMVLAGAAPGTPEARSVETALAHIEDGSTTWQVVRQSLEGLALALWHQEQARRGLTEEENRTLNTAHTMAQDDPALLEVTRRLDFAHVEAALAALHRSGVEIAASIDEGRPVPEPPSVKDAIMQALGKNRETELTEFLDALRPTPQASPNDVADLVVVVAGIDPGSEDYTQLVEELEGVPGSALGALQTILQALEPFSLGAPERPDDALVELGHSVDEARQTLRIWSVAALARQVQGDGTPTISLPDPDADRPPLRIGQTPLTSGALPEAPSLADALRALALAFGDKETAGQAESLVAAAQQALDPAGQEAVARVMKGVADYVNSARYAKAVPMPQALRDDPGLLGEWAHGLDAGVLPEPGSKEAKNLLEAEAFLDAQRDAAAAREKVLAAVEELVFSFSSGPQATPAAPSAGPSTLAASQHAQACSDAGAPETIRIGSYLSLDACGDHTQWGPEDLAMLVLDLGGDDEYKGRFGGAPFPGALGPTGQEPRSIPIAMLIDMGGSDTYEAGGLTCAQGAACSDLTFGLPDDTGLSYHGPMGVLIDWDGDEVDVHNEFHAGNRSQGYGAGDDAFSSAADDFTLGGYGILVERAGNSSVLSSTYEAGDFAQGSAVSWPADVAVWGNVPESKDGQGILIRLVGSDSQGSGVFRAGNHSQGVTSAHSVYSYRVEAVPLGLFANMAGERSVSNDDYQIHEFGQGAISQVREGESITFSSGSQVPADRQNLNGVAMFVDTVGHSGQSDDTYKAFDRVRGYSPGGSASRLALGITQGQPQAIFLDLLLPDQPRAEVDTDGPIRLGLTSDAPRSSSNDTYVLLGPGGRSEGYGPVPSSLQGSAFFLDAGGDDDYEHRAGGPANNATWRRPNDSANLGSTTLDSVGAFEPTGQDTAGLEDRDMDGVPAIVEQLWNSPRILWQADEDDDQATPLPVSPRVFIDSEGIDLELDDPFGFVLTVAGDDFYGENFSAAVHFDLGGDDVHTGRPGAAVGVAAGTGNVREEAPSPAGVNSLLPPPDARNQPPVRQHFLSFLLDAAGSDTYQTGLTQTQGFGADGAAGILFDLEGEDWYEAPDHAQGAGQRGGFGVLVDLHDAPGAALEGRKESNVFLAGSPSQGSSSERGFGLLVATGHHNTLPDDDEDPEDGWRVNAGEENHAPIIDDWSLPQEPAAGVAAAFSATAVDEDGDPLTFEWRFFRGDPDDPDHDLITTTTRPGGVDSAVEYTWTDVRTDAHTAGREQNVTYDVTLTVLDSGGRSATATGSLNVSAPTPDLLGTVRGPAFVPAAALAAFQVPLVFDADQAPYSMVVDWGDGTVDVLDDEYQTAVDWADVRWGAHIQLPDRIPGPSGPLDVDTSPLAALQNPIDPTQQAPARFTHRADATSSTSPFHIDVNLPGQRQIGRIEVDASAAAGSAAIRLSVEAVHSGGIVEPLGFLEIPACGTTNCPEVAFTRDMPLPDLERIVLRQLVTGGAVGQRFTMNLHDVRALGPGATHAWAQGGWYDMDLRVATRFNATRGIVDVPVAVTSTDAAASPDRISVVDLGRRGAVQHATFVQDTLYTLQLASSFSSQQDRLCIRWGDETEDCLDDADEDLQAVPVAGQVFGLSHAWAEPGIYSVVATHTDPASGAWEKTLAVVHVENGVELWTDPNAPPQTADMRRVVPPQGGVPLLLFVDDPDAVAGGRSWHVPLTSPGSALSMPLQPVPSVTQGTAFLAIVDGSGDDLYVDQVAVPQAVPVPPGQQANEGARPSMVIDAAGDDDYLSTMPATQGFGRWGAVGLLLDRDGNDQYVAPWNAQGAAMLHGAGALIDLGGDDVFNPIDPLGASHPTGVHPDVLSGLPSQENPWTMRPPSLAAVRSELRRSQAELVQGAALEGLGILILDGGHDSLRAGDRAQGFGGHVTPDFMDYFSPRQGFPCGMPEGIPHENLAGYAQYLQGLPNAPVAHQGAIDIACMLGIDGIRSDLNYYAPEGGIWQPIYQGPQGNDARCGGQGGIVPNYPCPPVAQVFTEFALGGPRYGPGVGILLRSGGDTSYTAASQAQGSASPAGRGLLIDLDGGAILSATDSAQSYALDGYAATVLGGPSVLRLGQGGQAQQDMTDRSDGDGDVPENRPEPVQQDPVSVLVGQAGDWWCSTCDGSGTHVGEDPTPGLAAPTVAVEASRTASDLMIDVALMDITDGSTAAEMVVLTQARLPDGAGGCSGIPLGPPATVVPSAAHPIQDDYSFVFDLGAMLPDGPVQPAGCIEVHALARNHVGPAMVPTEWGRGTTLLTMLHPPSVVAVPESVVSDGTPSTFAIATQEPLVQHLPIVTDFALSPSGDCATDRLAASTSTGSWSPDGTVDVTWDPTGVTPGIYILCSQSAWQGSSETGDWTDAGADVILITGPPGPDAVDIQDPIDGQTRRAGSPLQVAGTIQASEAACLELRFWDPLADAPVGLVGTGPVATCPSGVGDVPWTLEMRLDTQAAATFRGGPAVLQATLTGITGVQSAWYDMLTVHFDRDAPRITQPTTTPVGTNASSATHVVPVRLQVADGSKMDCAGAACPAGSGVAADEMNLMVHIRTAEGDALEQLHKVSSASSGDVLTVDFEWDRTGENEVPEGQHPLFLYARDGVGNVLVQQTGLELVIDREPPRLLSPGVEIPPGQAAVKPGDTLQVSAFATDTWLHNVTATVAGQDPVELQPDTSASNVDDRFTGSIELTESIAGDYLAIDFVAIDLADNPTQRGLLPGDAGIPIYRDLEIDDLDVKARSDAIILEWTLDRDLVVEGHVRPDGAVGHGENITGQASRHGDTHILRFDGLALGTQYNLSINITDPAGNSLNATDLGLEQVTTPGLPEGTSFTLTAPAGTRSGTVGLTVEAFAPQDSDVTLHLGSPDADPLFEAATIKQLDGDQTLDFSWDTRTTVPESLAGAVDATIHLCITGLSLVCDTTLDVRVDNSRPVLAARLEGPAAVKDGWHPGTVIAWADATDDTAPLAYGLSLDGGDPVDAPSLAIAEDGEHVLDLAVADGADPPNEQSVQIVVKVDRTPPELEVSTPLPAQATRDGAVPLAINASDATAGIDGYRIQTADGWTTWMPEAPAGIQLAAGDDREEWIDIEVRDLAGNVQRRSIQVLVDGTAPELLAAEWLGTSVDGADVLHVVARDKSPASGRPSGVSAVRFAANTTDAHWSPWVETTGNEAFAVSAELLDNETGMVLQVRDFAGNVAPKATVAPPGAASDPAPERIETQPLLARLLLTQASVTPDQGMVGDDFAFSVLAHPYNRSLPSQVYLELDGERTPMEPSGPAPADGGRLYVATLTPDVSSFSNGHSYAFIAAYKGTEVVLGPYDGPVVTVQTVQEADHGKKAPGLPLGGALVLLFLAATTRTRRRSP